MVCLTAKEAWKQVQIETKTPIGYTGFTRWLKKFGIPARPGIDFDSYQLIHLHARLHANRPTRKVPSAQDQMNALKLLASYHTIEGSDLLSLVIATGALSRATLYRRSKEFFGQPFSTERTYSKVEARRLITGF